MSSAERTASGEAERTIASLDWEAARVRSVQLVRVVRDTHDTFVAELRGQREGTERTLFLKQYRTTPTQPRPPAESARIEVDMLTSLASRLPERSGAFQYTVPGLVLHDTSKALFVVERASGEAVDAVIGRARNQRKIERAEPVVGEVGRWLRAMQDATATRADAAPIVQRLLATATSDLGAAAAKDKMIARSADAIRSFLSSSRERLEKSVIAGHHGDFWPGNVFVGDRSIAVLDFEGFRNGLVLEDVAYFLIHLEMYFRLPMMGRQFARLKRAFLDGYSGGAGVSESELHIMTIIKGLQTLARGGAASSRGLRNWLIHRTVRNRVLRSLRG